MNEILEEKIREIKKNEIDKEVILQFLCAYYDDYINGWAENDYIYSDEDEEEEFPEELTMPLDERISGVFEAITWLTEQGYDLNEGEDDCPLMMTVGYADAPMTQFLIQHGADPTKWPFMEETPEKMRSNYYLDDIDIAYFDEHWPRTERYVQALLQTAKVLTVDGKLGGYGGLCLLIDEEKREITLGSPKWKY